MKHYFAYGMNTSISDMHRRRPNARVIGKAILPGYELQFKQHCDVVKNPDSYVEGVLWALTNDDLKTLDIVEGVPYYYQRVNETVSHNGKAYYAEVYVMVADKKMAPPMDYYLDLVYAGYKENGVNTQQLENAFFS